MTDKPGCGCIRCYERERDELRAENERLRAIEPLYASAVSQLQDSGLGQVGESCINDLLPRLIREHAELRAEAKRRQADIDHYYNETLRLDAETTHLRAENERLRAALKRAGDAPCSHCAATWLHGERSTAHHWADQALGHHKEC